jgi:hypothetical protein
MEVIYIYVYVYVYIFWGKRLGQRSNIMASKLILEQSLLKLVYRV